MTHHSDLRAGDSFLVYCDECEEVQTATLESSGGFEAGVCQKCESIVNLDAIVEKTPEKSRRPSLFARKLLKGMRDAAIAEAKSHLDAGRTITGYLNGVLVAINRKRGVVKIDKPKDWWIKKAETEGDFEVAAGLATPPPPAAPSPPLLVQYELTEEEWGRITGPWKQHGRSLSWSDLRTDINGEINKRPKDPKIEELENENARLRDLLKRQQHFNGLTPEEAELLAFAAEEAAEFIHIVMKTLRHGIESKHPVTGKTNRELLEQENGDFDAAKELLMRISLTRPRQVLAATLSKLHRIGRYLHHYKPSESEEL